VADGPTSGMLPAEVTMRHEGLVILCAALLVPACGGDDHGPSATAEVTALGGSGVSGTVTFTTQASGKVLVEATIKGLTPGKHGFHVHEWGDCGNDAEGKAGGAAGGHFNPDGHDHGAPGAMSHPGDLGNLEADANGNATLSLETDHITVDTGKVGIAGRGLIVHADPDDLMSQPVGMAGARIGCAVIMLDEGSTTPVKGPAM
jgi:superoxide dismutase, Cu-Zn family